MQTKGELCLHPATEIHTSLRVCKAPDPSSHTEGMVGEEWP